MPMCQSPKVAHFVLQATKTPANDNDTSAVTSIKFSKPTGTFKAAWQTCLILLCVTVLLLL